MGTCALVGAAGLPAVTVHAGRLFNASAMVLITASSSMAAFGETGAARGGPTIPLNLAGFRISCGRAGFRSIRRASQKLTPTSLIVRPARRDECADSDDSSDPSLVTR